MTESRSDPWYEANQRYLMAELDSLRELIINRSPGQSDTASHAPSGERPFEMRPPPAIESLCALFRLSRFERAILLLCAGVELDSEFAWLLSGSQGNPLSGYPTFSLALSVLPDAHWSALSPAAPLRSWRLIEVGQGSSLTASPLRIDERILHYLAGVGCPDERLSGIIRPVFAGESLPPSHGDIVEKMTSCWHGRGNAMEFPVLQLCGDDVEASRCISAAACAGVGMGLYALPASAIPQSRDDLAAFTRLWQRESALSGSALLVELDDAADAARETAISYLLDNISTPLIIQGRARRRIRARPYVTYDVAKPTAREQRKIWEESLGAIGDIAIDALADQFDLGRREIMNACAEALGQHSPGIGDGAGELNTLLWNACRSGARPDIGDLAQRIEPVAGWDDLVLPPAQLSALREIAGQVRYRSKVYDGWGFARKSARGLGISALFAGQSGTGKTLAAEVLAGELRLDLYRIDLSQVVSKYIGETEKNLRRVFDAAEGCGAILLFDEADALFGKRSEVRDSHDRYANIEISYLLQRMEAYRGLAILTSNMRGSLDPAFLRRIRFIVDFPFPDQAQRAEIWKRVFPADVPLDGVDVAKLSRLNVVGGSIRNIALNAAFLAAGEGGGVKMRHLLQAARREYAKSDKPLTDTEIKGWV